MRITCLCAMFFCAIFFCLTACNDNEPKAAAAIGAEPNNDSLVKRGEYLVSTIGCDDCHSPKTMGPKGPELDMAHRLSGYPADRPLNKTNAAALKSGWMLMNSDLTSFVGPWGISFSANITGDETGIGNWSEAQFINAMRSGRVKGLDSGRMMLPPMPWQNFSKLTDPDLKAMFAFLKSTKPVHNVVPAPLPPIQMQ